MASDVLRDLGYLFLGSRLKRLAERMQGDAAQIIRDVELPIQPSQFPLLAALDRCGPMAVSEAVDALGISQPAVTRIASGLIELGLVESSRGEPDLRQKTLALSQAGEDLMTQAKSTMWPPLQTVVEDMCADLSGPFLQQIAMLEDALERDPLDARVRRQTRRPPPDLSIREYADDLAPLFHDINAEWIGSMFAIEDNDVKILTDPRGEILERGGFVLFVEAKDLGVVGTCAVMKIDEGCFELTKMGVSERARGRKAGEFLLQAALDRAAAMDIDLLYLLTNTKCAAAIHLYEKLGFVHDAEILRTRGARYDRCNVAMRHPLPGRAARSAT